jgi:hypothetical protein
VKSVDQYGKEFCDGQLAALALDVPQLLPQDLVLAGGVVKHAAQLIPDRQGQLRHVELGAPAGPHLIRVVVVDEGRHQLIHPKHAEYISRAVHAGLQAA